MKHTYSGEYKDIKLVPLEEEHIENLRLLRNKHRHRFVYSGLISEEAQKKWYQNYLNKENDYSFSVLYDDIWIGSVSIYGIEGTTAEFGRLLIDSEKANRHGLGTDTTICACNIAFEMMGIKTIILEVYEDNPAAYKTYIKSGFSETGVSYDKEGKKLINMTIEKK